MRSSRQKSLLIELLLRTASAPRFFRECVLSANLRVPIEKEAEINAGSMPRIKRKHRGGRIADLTLSHIEAKKKNIEADSWSLPKRLTDRLDRPSDLTTDEAAKEINQNLEN